MSAKNREADIPQHLVVENAALGAADQDCRALVGNMAAAVLKALEAHAVEYILQIGNLFRRQLCANTFKSCIRQGSSSRW